MIYVGTYRKSSKDTRNSFIFLQVLLAFGIWIFNKGKRIYNTYLLTFIEFHVELKDFLFSTDKYQG